MKNVKLTTEEKSMIIYALTKLHDSDQSNFELKEIRETIEKLING
jgi:hypothetical protein